MKTKKHYFKTLALAALATLTGQELSAQTSIGAACGCPAISARGAAINISSLPGYQAISGTFGGELTQNTTLTCDKLYNLDVKIYIPNGKTLTIEPGTVIKAADNSASTSGAAASAALIVSVGGKIMASGT